MDEKLKIVTIGLARGIREDIAGTEYYFLYSGYSMFKIQDSYGPCVLPELSVKDKSGMESILAVSEILTEAAALACKKQGVDDIPVFRKGKHDEYDIAPYIYMALQNACTKSANVGYIREIEAESEEVDLVLLRHQKKRGTSEPSTSKTES